MHENKLYFIFLVLFISIFLSAYITFAQAGGGAGGGGGGGFATEGCWALFTNVTCLNSSDDYNCLWHDNPSFGTSWGWCEQTTQKNCWQYSNNSSCSNFNCSWSGYGYCSKQNCWDYKDKSNCEQAYTTSSGAIDCRWETMGTSSTTDDYCYEQGCWVYSANETCTAAACTWGSQGSGGSCYSQGCWDYQTETTCNAQTTCNWEGGSNCRYKSCWDYTTNTTCLNSTAHPNFNCRWNTNNNYCYEQGCWDYTANETCLNTSDSLDCAWNSGSNYCYKSSCYDYTAQTNCESILDSLNCYWDSYWGNCYEQGCWNYNNQSSCQGASCTWRSSGWCNRYECWAFNDSSSCTNNPYGLSCTWSSEPHCEYGNNSSAVDCWQYNSSTNCANAGCAWKLGWCSRPGCWDYHDSTNCTDAGEIVHPNVDCTWRSDQYGNSWCEEQNCWLLNETNCENNTLGLSCRWDNSSRSCYMKSCWDYGNEGATNCTDTGGTIHPKFNCSWDTANNFCYEPGCSHYNNQSSCISNNCAWEQSGGYCDPNSSATVNCWDLTNNASCSDHSAECTWEVWGYCNDKQNCWSQTTKTDCEALTATKRCVWNTEYLNCYQKSCWEYAGNTTCLAAGCGWDGSYCYDEGCWKYSDQDNCFNLTDSLQCSWQTYQYCYRAGCWDYTTNTTCLNTSDSLNCNWQSSGWCGSFNESGTNCWQYYNLDSCNAALGCNWTSNSWCEEKGSWYYNDQSSCEGANFTWATQGGWCNEPSTMQCWNYNQTECQGIHNSTCRWEGSSCMNRGCWEFYDNTSCGSAPSDLGCSWATSSQASTGWCEQLDCWSFMNQTACGDHVSDMKCSWATFGWCEQRNCWMLSNSDSCLNSSDSLDCNWDAPGSCTRPSTPCTLCADNGCAADPDDTTCNGHAPWCQWNNTVLSCEINTTACNQTIIDACNNCYSQYTNSTCAYPCNWTSSGWCENDFGSWGVDCWQYWNDSATCDATEGCRWKTGNCNEKGCWSYSNNQTRCENSTAYHPNFNCTWKDTWCEDKGCWNYWNETACDAAHAEMGCTWHVDEWNSNSGWCEEPGCWNANDGATCNATVVKGVNCSWQKSDFGGWCNMGGCPTLNETSCTGNCEWRRESHCEKARCWMWDLWNGGNETLCTSKGTTYGLNCSWSDSFCVQSQTGCDAFNGDKEGCFETMFCWWDKNTQTCNSPGDVGGGGWVTEAEGDKIDPGCWIFDYEQQYCNESYADVCRWNNATQKCAGMSSNAKITCGNIKNSELCENIPVLKTCCEWKNNKCQSNPESISCYANIEAPPQGAAFCEDYASYTSNETCANIAGSPWFMPCKWDGSNCVFRSEDMFGGEKKGCDSIAGKKECEFAGCEWTIEQYCNGTQAIPFGYCKEKTGIGSKSCNAACWACEWKDSTGNWVNSTNITFARTACQGSTLGYCNFTADSSAPNGIGFCNIPKDIQYIGDCNKDCKSCESKPNPQSSCGSSNANCKWVNDTTGVTTIGGWCYPKSEKSCSEDCFKCYDQISCVDYGGGSKGTCVWETETKICKPKNFDNEICFDGIDNDGDSRVDCDDADCFSDSFCGATTTSSCWQYSTESNCNIQGNNSNCIWIKNPWEGKEWCGLRGENCFLWDGDQTGCGNQSVCQWFPDPKGGFCDVDNTKVQTCFKATTQGACNINSDCYWQIDSTSSTGGTCKPKIFLCWDKTTQTNCTTGEWSSRCKWIIDNATGTGSCKPICFSNDLKTQTACDNNANCNWMGGFCDPAQQFGMKTEDCWKYDDNSTACNQVASCQFHTEASGGMCDINFTMNQETCTYITNQTGCMAAGGGICKWNQNEGNTFCDLKIFGCGFYQNNTTCLSDSQNYTNGVGCAWESGGWCECTQPPCDVSCGGIVDETSCNAFSSSGCGWRGPHCNPICFNQTNGLACGSKAPTCIWKQGFCEPKMVKTMFGGMEEKPIDLGGDECGVGSVDESLDDEVDICGFGMKEMPDNYGFGTGVLSLENAALCKGKKIVKQGPTGLQTITDSGTGLNTTRLYLYLDTDGSRTGNCWLWNDPDQDGYEFFFNYVAEIIDGEVKETKTSYRCKDSNWVVADIKLSGFRTLMCSEIGSMMISVNRDDLKKFTTLFMSGEEMRVYMATASKKRTESLPSDTVGPGYYTPGSNDFRPEDCLTSGVDMDSDGFNSENDPDCFMFYQMGGFMKYEDCFETGRDEDLDGLIDCNDPDCRIAPNCGGKGVNAANYNDTSIPTLTWSDVKKFPDSAFIKYDSSEPANGTVFFYYNSSSCPNTNTSGKDRIIKDVTLLDNDTNNNYNNWHDTSIDNFDFNSQKLGYALESNTTYYYKIKLCDPSGNCGLSSCLNFTTAASSSRTNCPDCTFSFKLEGATDFKIDLGGTGTYTSLASEVGACEGTGLRVNYSQASKANVRAEGDDSAVVFENASLIGVSGILNITEGTTTSGGYSVGYAGIPSDVFDDIGGKMRPKICKIEIPKGTSGNCDKVWKCDDNVENCIDMTNNATLLNNTATLCIWQIPCDFSTYRTNSPTSTAETTGGGGGGGGGGGASGTTVLRAKGNVNITVSAISAGKTSNIAIYKTEDVAFRELNITVWKDVSKVKLVIMKLSTLPTAKDVDGKIYHYISIDKTNITDSDISKTYIKFAVEKSWINSNKIDPLTIHLYRWETDRWNSLTTSKVAENSEEIFYRAEFSGLSYFAIAGYKVGEAPTGAAIACIENWSCTEWSACVANQQTRTCTDANNCGTTADKPAESRECLLTAEFAWGFAPLTYIVIVAVIIIIAIGIVIWRQKHKR